MMKRHIQVLFGCTAVLCLASAALATQSATLTFSKPTNTTATTVKVVINPGDDAEVEIPPGTNAEGKRNLIRDKLVEKGYDVTTAGLAGNQLKIQYLANGTKVEFRAGSTGELKDDVVGDMASEAKISFGVQHGLYEPYDTEGHPALFTAGFFSEYGEYAVTLSAEDLGFNTHPEFVCLRLFELLAPVAPDYGVDLFLIGDVMEFHFDPTAGGVNAGISFGTTSPTDGLQGWVRLGDLPNPCIGDVNGDLRVDLSDLAELLGCYGAVAGDPLYNPDADLNNNGRIDIGDLAALLAHYGDVCE